jgi:hypothetical protein
MVIQKAGDRLYYGVRDVVAIQVYSMMRDALGDALLTAPGSDATFAMTAGGSPDSVRWLQRAWQDHTLAMSMIKDILMYMVSLKEHCFWEFFKSNLYLRIKSTCQSMACFPCMNWVSVSFGM